MSVSSTVFSLGSFSSGASAPFLGALRGSAVTRLADLAPASFTRQTTLRQLLNDWPLNFAILSEALSASRSEAGSLNLAELRVHAPLPDPRQVFCTGANYRQHVVEMVVALGNGAETENMGAEERRRYGEAYVARQQAESRPYVFMKPVTAVAGPFDDLRLPAHSAKMDWELELAAVIAGEVYQVTREAAMAHVAGYMVVNDLTARDKVRRTDPGAIGPDWIAAKGGPGFLPCGPYFVPSAFVRDPLDLAMRLSVNGELMQDDRTSDMTFDIATQIEFISGYARMLPGDILCTGSPKGNGIARGVFLKEGDVMEAEIAGLGTQRVRCVAPAVT